MISYDRFTTSSLCDKTNGVGGCVAGSRASDGSSILIRDDKVVDGLVLEFFRVAWQLFTAVAKSGAFTVEEIRRAGIGVAVSAGVVTVELSADDMFALYNRHRPDQRQHYTEQEWADFIGTPETGGVMAGEFDLPDSVVKELVGSDA